MNPNQPKPEQPGLNLPQPSFEAAEQKTQPVAPEMDYQIPKTDASQSQGGALVPVASATTVINPITASNQPIPVAKSTALTNVPHAAGDIDLIEKEWMVKAKHLLSKNRNNPYAQAREMTLLRAAYLKKRFNKDIKITDG